MVNSDMISQVSSMLKLGNLAKMRACYVEYSRDYDGREECRNYELRIKTAQNKPRSLSWTSEIYAIKSVSLSSAAAKYFTCKSILDSLVKEADGIVAQDRADSQARAKAIDEQYTSFVGVLSDDRIAQARVFIKSYHATPSAVLAFCQKATSAEIKKFETRLDVNQKENVLRAKAEGLDKKYTTVTASMKRDRTSFKVVDAFIAEVNATSADVRRFCKVATADAMKAMANALASEKKYLDCEEAIDRLAASKTLTSEWYTRVWKEYAEMSAYVDKCRNAQKLRSLYNEANDIAAKEKASFQAKARELDSQFDSFAGTLSDDRIAQARAFIKSYRAISPSILAYCVKATSDAIKKLDAHLDVNQKENAMRANADALDRKYNSLIASAKREHVYLNSVEAFINEVNSTSADVRRFCKTATAAAVKKLQDNLKVERLYLGHEQAIDNLGAAKTRSVAWCQRAWQEYNNLLSVADKCRNGQKLKDLNNEAHAMYVSIICEPYVNALSASSNFKTVIELDGGLRTFDKKDVLYKGIPSFDDKWKKRVEQAWTEARKKAHEYFIQGKTYYDQKQYSKSLDLLLEANKYENKECQCFIAHHYYYGYGVAKNLNTAISYYKIAANNGDLTAMNYLGDIYETSSPTEAFAWRKRSVDGGGVYSRLALAKMYYDGRGTAKNSQEARKLFEKLAKEGNVEANAYMGRICEFEAALRASRVKDNSVYDEALAYYRKGYSISWAKKAYDELYHRLEEERRDNEIEYHLDRAKSGYPESMCFIGECYYKGYRTTQSYDMAFDWFKKAASKGNGKAMSYLGDMYMNGQGVKADLKKAKKYYQDAIKHGER